MISPGDFYNILKSQNIDFFSGVPDSLLKDFCAYLTDNCPDKNHIICANEGNAIALCAGHYLKTSNPGLVYMQNSGLGNSINPLLSLADSEVYSIPLLMLIGLRGEINTNDEPQHVKQGKVTDKILEACDIKYSFLPKDSVALKKALIDACEYIKKYNKPFAFIVKKGSFESYKTKNILNNNYKMTRLDALETVLGIIDNNDIVVSSTGFISRELYELRKKNNRPNIDFLTVGSMGHTSSIALGVALNENRNVYCLEGDGSLIMHLGSVCTVSKANLSNFKHILFNNEAHDSTGAQKTCADVVDFSKLLKSCGYKKTYSVETKGELIKTLKVFKNQKGPVFLEIKVRCGAKKDLIRPDKKPVEIKKDFMSYLNSGVVYSKKGAIKNLSKIIRENNFKNILIFSTKTSFERHKKILQKELLDVPYTLYNNITQNCKEKEVAIALKKLKNFDFIIALGGGSTIDFAKIFRYCYDNNITPKQAIELNNRQVYTPLLAIPTTAGTGAEVTKFAVVYIDNIKYSVESTAIVPNYAIIDGYFSKNNPKYLKACCALDALCQAIESYWSVNSTNLSKYYAKCAMELLQDNLCLYVKSNSEKYAQNMAEAAMYSGKAINISKTTISHALSYTITAKYNINHGHAVALSIKGLMKKNASLKNITDKRGYDYLKNTMDEIKQILNIKDIDEYFDNLFRQIGIETSLKKLNIDSIKTIVDNVNIERMKNNPVKLDKKELEALFEK